MAVRSVGPAGRLCVDGVQFSPATEMGEDI